MTPADRKTLRENILAQCNQAPRKGVAVSEIINVSARMGYDGLTGADVDREIRHLEGQGFIRPVDQKLSPGVRFYSSTPAGDDYLEVNGLA